MSSDDMLNRGLACGLANAATWTLWTFLGGGGAGSSVLIVGLIAAAVAGAAFLYLGRATKIADIPQAATAAAIFFAFGFLIPSIMTSGSSLVVLAIITVGLLLPGLLLALPPVPALLATVGGVVLAAIDIPHGGVVLFTIAIALYLTVKPPPFLQR